MKLTIKTMLVTVLAGILITPINILAEEKEQIEQINNCIVVEDNNYDIFQPSLNYNLAVPRYGNFYVGGFLTKDHEKISVLTETVTFYGSDFNGITSITIPEDDEKYIISLYTDSDKIKETKTKKGKCFTFNSKDLTSISINIIYNNILEEFSSDVELPVIYTSDENKSLTYNPHIAKRDKIMGDVNRDNEVNLIDLIEFKKILNQNDREYTYGFLDFDANNRLDEKDLEILKRLLIVNKHGNNLPVFTEFSVFNKK